MKSPYKVLILVLNILSLLLLTLICFNLEIFSLSLEIDLLPDFKSFVSNDYVVNILCTFITAVALYIFQIMYSKRKIRKDFRCNEVIQDIYTGIEEALKLKTKSAVVAQKCNGITHEDHNTQRKLRAQVYIDFYKEHETTFDLCNLGLTYSNNDILIESVQSVFFINLNFKLLSIINHIKNRRPNLIETYPKIEQLFEQYQITPTDSTIVSLGESISAFLVDVGFLASYWLSLLNYLKYDPIPSKLYIAEYKKLYPEDTALIEHLKLPRSKQRRIAFKVSMRVCWEYLKYKIKHFFD